MKNRVVCLLPLVGIVCLLSSCASHCVPEGVSPIDCSRLKTTQLPEEPSPEGKSYPALTFGKSGPPVLLIHAMNGVSAKTVELGELISTWGYRVWIPNLYEGTEFGKGIRVSRAQKILNRSGDWTSHSSDGGGNIVRHLGEMVTDLHGRTGEKVIVIGNCLTGITPLELIHLEGFRSGVLCQPATPLLRPVEVLFSWIPDTKRTDLGISSCTVNRVIQTMQQDCSKKLAGFHYTHDPLAPMERFDVLHGKFEEGGVADQFKTWIAYPEGTEPESWWSHSMPTESPKRLTSPHSTIINSVCRDVDFFRSGLKAALAELR